MKNIFKQSYTKALQGHLIQGSTPQLEIGELASQARASGVTTLEIAKLHEDILLSDVLADVPARSRPALIRRAADFFAAITTPEKPVANGKGKTPPHARVIAALSRRILELATAKKRLTTEIARRKALTQSLKASETQYAKSFQQAEYLKERLQALSRQILTMQEEERKKISRDLHDVVAQSLMSINVRLATLKRQTGLNARDFNRTISATEKLLEKAAHIVHRFASGLRPPALDDIGLLPALQSLMKDFMTRTGVRANLEISRGLVKLPVEVRTVLFRVTQEALTNVERHAAASGVKITIRESAKTIKMTIKDDGKSFQVERVLRTRGSKHLGLLGMRERVEMVGGSFDVDSSPGNGTVITVRIPNQPPGKTRSKTKQDYPL